MSILWRVSVFTVVLAMAAPALAQIPLPVEEDAAKRQRAGRKSKDPVRLKKDRLEALGRQLRSIQAIRNWARTNSRELQKIYSDSKANLAQAHAAIAAVKGTKQSLTIPRAFEIEPIRVGTGTLYPSSSSGKVAEVPPDDFRLFLRVTFPQQWVEQKKRLRVGCQIYPESYLPMASQYQNTTKAIYRAQSYSQRVNRAVTTFNIKVNGLSLQPGRYFTSCVVSTASYPREFLASLGMFKVKGSLPAAVGRNLPHHHDWYRTYKPRLKLEEAHVKQRGRAIQLSGRFTRTEFEKGQEPVWVVVVAERNKQLTVILRKQLPLKRASTRFGGGKFMVREHGLSPGLYKVRVGIYTEHPSSKSKYSFQRGSRAEKTIDLDLR